MNLKYYFIIQKRIMLNHAQYFRFIFSMILFSRLFVSRFLLPAVSSPLTENTRSTYASDAGDDRRSWTSGANSGYLLAFVTQNLRPLFSKAADTRQTNVGQHLFANNVGKQKSVVCSRSWPTFYVGQQCLRFTNLFVFCWPTNGKPCAVIGWL